MRSLVWSAKPILTEIRDRAWLALHRYTEEFRIDGSKNRNINPAYVNSSSEPNFQKLLENFKIELHKKVNSRDSFSYFKFGDGDYYFLEGIPKGSAKPGNRAISRTLTSSELLLFQRNSELCDSYLCEIPMENRNLFMKAFPGKTISYPAEFVYGLLANRWFTREFSQQVGVIGADTKIDLIKVLMEKPAYQEYLGLATFQSYLTVPQKFACDDLETRYSKLKQEVLESECRFFLVGVGHLKSGILGRLAKDTNSVILDVGSGIDALAGVISGHRPYFGGWTNFQCRDEFDYSKVDYLQYKNSRIANV